MFYAYLYNLIDILMTETSTRNKSLSQYRYQVARCTIQYANMQLDKIEQNIRNYQQ